MQNHITINGKAEPFQSQPLSDWLSARGITPAQGGIAVAVNSKIVRREEWPSFTPKSGDEIEIITAVSGG